MVDSSLGGRGLSSRLVGSVGAELDHLLGAGAGHGADELAGEEDLEHGWVQPHGDDLAGQVPAGGELLVADADQAAGRHPAGDLGRADGERLAGLDSWDRGCRGRRWLEAPGRDSHGDGLVGALGVVVGNPGVQQLLGLGQGVEAAAGEQLGSQGLVEAFDLAGGGRAADAGEPVGDALFAADGVEQDLGWVGAEAAGEDLAVVGEDFLGGAVVGQAAVKLRQTLRALARSMSPAATQNREWSSMPVPP
jgi:hypothetical protein